MSTATLNTRLKKIQSVEDGLSLEQWKAKFIRNPVTVPRHVLVGIIVGRIVKPHVADALERHPTYRAWLASLRDGLPLENDFAEFCKRQGTDIESILTDARKNKGH
jgi:hypothetical protein